MSNVVLVRAARFLDVRNGLLQNGVRNGHRWGCVVEAGTFGITTRDKLGGFISEITFELPNGWVVTDNFSNSDFVVLE